MLYDVRLQMPYGMEPYAVRHEATSRTAEALVPYSIGSATRTTP